MLKRLLIMIIAVAGLTGASGYGLRVYYKSQIFNPSMVAANPADSPFPVSVVDIPTSDGLILKSWWSAPRDNMPTVLYLHGNATHVGTYTRGAAPLVAAGYGVLMLEYRGYGGNPGTLSDAGFLLDGHAALDWLEARGIPSRSVLIYGYSLGTGIAVPLAAQRDNAALVLAAPFASIAEIGYDSYPRWFVDILLSDRFDSIAAINAVRAPILIIHGSEDETIPPHQSEKLAKAAPDADLRRIVFDGAGHGWDLFEPRGNAAILSFLAEQTAQEN